jgi:hypothetical protein
MITGKITKAILYLLAAKAWWVVVLIDWHGEPSAT